ncbi:MAG: MipA/OmpV family protein [Bacteriovoracaceae bacterium]
MKTFLFLFTLILNSHSLQAQYIENPNDPNLPKYEVGAGFGYARFPSYPGSDVDKTIAIPFPTFIYRGDVVRADEDGGFRGRFFKNDRLEINLSIGGSLPADSDDNLAREGMPDLKTIIELGPGFVFRLIPRKENRRLSVILNLPLRIPLEVDFDEIDDRGWVFNPLLFSTFDLIRGRVQLFNYFSYRYGNREFHQTFFEVDPKYETQSRPTYYAQKGDVLFSYGLGLGYRPTKRWNMFCGIDISDLSNNPNKSSPLVKEEKQMSFGFGFIWWFYHSDKKQFTR